MRVVRDKLLLSDREQRIVEEAHGVVQAILDRLGYEYRLRGLTGMQSDAENMVVDFAVLIDHEHLEKACFYLMHIREEYEIPRDFSMQVGVLHRLALERRRIPLSRVARSRGLSLCWASRVINQLERYGLVEVRRINRNGRHFAPGKRMVISTDNGRWAASDPRYLGIVIGRIEEGEARNGRT